MQQPDLKTLLDHVVAQLLQAGKRLAAEWARGYGDKAPVDVEIEQQLREALLQLLPCDFWGEETGHVLTGHSWCWVIDPNDGTRDFL